ncbi:MAG: aminomethyl-transferring glycine dehydrogenase subunit GcvPA [Pseudomonadota bacterium]|nr:aminomethyl-transferring glycine dehydrogenase subunit GcvPA [Pseudomonadota bacterium]
MPFIPHTEAEVGQMLARIDAPSVAALFEEIPSELRAAPLDLHDGLNEMDVLRWMGAQARKDEGTLCFAGAGCYDHHIPAAVWDIATRGEFMTAYTPYQAEASQGTLQLIYEYQSMMAHLMAMDLSNASLYDGASGLGEALLMAVRGNRGSRSRRVLVADSLNPRYRGAAQTIVGPQHIELVPLALDASGVTDTEVLAEHEGLDFAALVIQQPNYFGRLESVHSLTDWAHAQGMLVIAVVNPIAAAVLAPPGEWGESGADIAVGDGQPLGIPMASGGPSFGFMCCTERLVRQMPGRLIGRATDARGTPGYTLVLQAREQHIRRSKATSNICTNQGLLVTAATIHMALLGATGLAQVATACHHANNQLLRHLTAIPGVQVRFDGPHFHEAAVRLPVDPATVLTQLAAEGILGGVPLAPDYPGLSDCLLVCATEMRTDADMARFAGALARTLTAPPRCQAGA